MAKLPDVGALGERPVARPTQGVVQYGVPDGGAPGQITQSAGRAVQIAGATLASAGDEAWRALKVEEDRLATIQAEDAFTRLRDKQLELTLGEKTGFANVKSGGVVRPDFFTEYSGKFSEAARAIEAEVPSDRAKEKFRLRAGAAGMQFKENLLQHVMRETDVHARRTLEVALNSEVAAVGANPQSDGAMRFSLERVNNMIAREVDRQGLTGSEAAEAVKVAQDAARDKMWTARIDALLYTQPVAADAAFRKAAADNEITDPKLRLQLQHKVREASLSVIAGIEAQKTVDEVRNAVPPAAAGTFNVGSAPSAPGTSGDMSVPRSVRNNNPGNIEKSGIKWQGQVEGGDSRFVTFATPEDGMRAMQQNLLAYQTKHGLNTVDAIIRRWAPAKENGEESTKNYVSTVARSLGVAPNAPLDLKDPTTMAAMTQAMANVEAGGQYPAGGGGTRRVSTQAPQDPFAQNTNGLPNSRDVAAQLPIMMMRVEKRANELYGVEIGNPDRAAFVTRMQNEIKARVSADVQQLNALQKQAQGTLIDAVAGLGAGGQGGIMPAGGQGQGGQQPAPITSFAQIQANPKLFQAWQMMDPQAKLGIERLMEHNMRAVDKGDAVLFRELFNRIHQESGTPGKIDFYQQIVDPKVADRLSMEQIRSLRMELDRSETPGGRSINQLRKGADANVAAFFRTNIMLTAQPERQIAATMRWNEDAGRKMDEYVKAGKDVRSLFMLDTPDSMVNQKYLQTYVTGTPAQGLAASAAQVRAGEASAVVPPIAQPKDIDSREKLDAWFQTLPATQTTFTGTDGKVRLIPGRSAQPAPTTAPTMDQQGKLNPATPAARFDPEGDGYDMESAVRAGLQPDATGHWPSRDPKTGMLLKGRGHETWEKTRVGEREAGMEVYKGSDGRYYSRPANPPKDIAEPGMPKLVERVTQAQKAALRQAAVEEGMDKNFAYLERVLPAILPYITPLGAAYKATKAAGKALGTAALEAIPDDAEAAARGFRMLARSGTYMRESAPLIRDAIEGGNLNPKELAMAQKMLAAIEGGK